MDGHRACPAGIFWVSSHFRRGRVRRLNDEIVAFIRFIPGIAIPGRLGIRHGSFSAAVSRRLLVVSEGFDVPILGEEPSLFPETLLEGPVEADPGRRWRVLYTKARQEKSLARELRSFQIPFYLPLVKKITPAKPSPG
jgi:hypothetical protein